jgi:hypothetical protein
MKIDAHGAVGEPGARGDFWAAHALDEAKNERIAVGVGKGVNGLENGVGFGGGVGGSGGRRRRMLGVLEGGIFAEFIDGLAAAVKVGGAVASDGGKPAGEFGNFAKREETREGLEEDVLDEIVDVRIGNAGEENAMNHAGVAGVELTEGGAIALLGGADEGFIRSGFRGRVHDRESVARGMEFVECRHVASIERKTVS